jgi:hypothetical protein
MATAPVRTGRWMARRDEPFAVFVFRIPEYALCLGLFSLVTADRQCHSYAANWRYQAAP